jgi:SAM-dependent methyltransferase
MESTNFWSSYQPGFRSTRAPVGSTAFFEEVSAARDLLEPHIPEVVGFERWAGCEVLEAGCGIATDGARFAAASASYTGVDASPTAVSLARHRFDSAGLPGRFVRTSITSLPFPDRRFDLVFSHGVIHHIHDTEAALREFDRVLKPGGTLLVMVYHRHSLNYHLTIMLLRRALVGLLLFPNAVAAVAQLTGEDEQVVAGHRELLRTYGVRYIRDRNFFLSHNTDGPGNPLSKVYSRAEIVGLIPPGIEVVRTEVRNLNLRIYPGGSRLAANALGRRLERRIGWHLYVEGTKAEGRGRGPE